MDISILLGLQDFRNGAGAILAEFLAKMTFLGELNTAIVIMAIIYWSVNKDLGTYLLMGWSGNRIANGFLKITVCAYRPWVRDARIIPYGDSIATATGYSFPSGHSMNAASVFGGGAVRKDMPRALRVVLTVVVILVAFSRNYLGVHTPQDVLVGATVGMLVMWLVFKMMKWCAADPGRDRIILCVGLLLAAVLAFYAAVKPYPADYDAAGNLIVDGARMANDTFKGVGYCTAFLVGWFLERRFVGFSTDIPLVQKLMRVTTGLICYYAVNLILVPLIKGSISGPVGTLLSCFLQVFFVSFIFPACMKFIDALAAPHAGSEQPA